MKWRKYTDEKPDKRGWIIIGCHCCKNMDAGIDMGEFSLDNSFISDIDRCGLPSIGHGVEDIKYWIPLSELEETLPKDEK